MANTTQNQSGQQGSGFTRWVKNNYDKSYVAVPAIYLATRLGARIASMALKDPSIVEMGDLAAPVASGMYGAYRAQKIENPVLRRLATVLIGGAVGADIADTVLDSNSFSSCYEGLRSSINGLQRALEKPTGIENGRTAGMLAGMITSGVAMFAKNKAEKNAKDNSNQ